MNNRTHLPGQPDMWFFALFEALVFTSYFVVYLVTRTHHTELFLHSQAKLDMRVGALNTIALLMSSWAMARCVQTSRGGQFRSALRDVLLAALFGLVFLASKVVEWARLVRQGHSFTSDTFFSHYFFLTGIHTLHLVIGFVVLGVAGHQLRNPARQSQKLIETCATYWHTVDLLWVLIFSLLYVVR